jgi:hypothetical protein
MYPLPPITNTFSKVKQQTVVLPRSVPNADYLQNPGPPEMLISEYYQKGPRRLY